MIFLDADDYLPDYAIFNRVAGIKNHDFLSTDYFEEGWKSNPDRKCYDRICNTDMAIRYLFSPGKLGYQGYIGPKMFVLDIINKNKIRFDRKILYNEDRLFIYQYLRHCESAVISSDKTYVYVHNKDSKMGRIESGKFSYDMLTELDAFDIMKEQLKADNSSSYVYCCEEMLEAAFRLSDIVPDDEKIISRLKDVKSSNYREIMHVKGQLRLKANVIKDRILRGRQFRKVDMIR